MKSATNEEDDNASVVKDDNGKKSMQNVRKQKLFLINLLK